MQLAFILAEEGGLGGLGINLWAFLSQLISFIIVFIILWRFVLPVFIRTLDKRQQVIREGVENAERAKQELTQATERAEQELLKARQEAQVIIERATKDAQRLAQQIEEEARARAEQFSQQQVARIQQEANRARNELSRLVVNLSIDAAGKVVGKSVDNKDNRRLVEEFVTSSSQARNN
ncbi:MAG: F0F1 ATP synthase subunit B [Ktedonobacteraceae bacterium]|nr:F0F1 ATP synthase subunit B [Ktedonobacteraceae bacterium]MBO0796466.1 F0F1 ATP synthase subunit B [Ktedonobacteraceae bacterium]